MTATRLASAPSSPPDTSLQWRGVKRVAVILTLIAAPAIAEERPCDSRANIVAHLATEYGETLQSAGVTQSGTVLEVWASATTGTWTVLESSPEGTSCMVAAGQAFETRTAAPAGDPA
jgi:hypothetical protein